MRTSFFRTALAGCITASMLLVASAYADDMDFRAEQINPVAKAKDLPGPIVNGYYSFQEQINDYVRSSLPKITAPNLVGNQAHLYIKNNKATSNNPCDNDPNGGQNDFLRPIQISTGSKFETYPLFTLSGEMGLTYELYYTTTPKSGYWRDNLAYSLDTGCNYDPNNNGVCGVVKYYRADGSTLFFDGTPGYGPFTEEGGGGLATLTYDLPSASYTLHDEDGTTKVFGPNGLASITDPAGIGWTFSSTTVNGNSVTTVTHTNGQSITVTTGPSSSQVINGQTVTVAQRTITDPAGNSYSIVIAPTGYESITLPGSPTTVISFKYTTVKNLMLSEVDYNGAPYDYTTYVNSSTDPHFGWANGNYLADNSEGGYISYASDSAGNLQATLTNSLGHQTTQTYDGTNGSGGAYNGYLSLISDAAVITCAGTTHGRSYDANGHLAETIDNNGNVHTYTYAVNGQLQSETEAYGTPLARTTDYVWDSNQQLNRLLSETVEGWKKTTYTYNAQNRLASESVTNLSGNGSANQTLTTTYNYTLYGNGMVQTLTVTKPSPNGSDTDTSQYDTLGNLASFSNGLGQTTSYSNYNGLGEVGHVVGPNGDATDYIYDARGRVATKTTYPNGSAAKWIYAYDGFGLLYTLTGPDGQVTTWNRDATMRVQTITHNDKDGASTESFSYDANGDVVEQKVVRGSTVGLDEVVHYDTLGRVYQKLGQHGQSLTYAYDGNGNVLSVADAVGHTVTNQYDALNRVTQKTEGGGASPALPSPAPTLNAPGNNINGAYTVSWNSITGATTYELQEQVNGGSWSTVQASSAITWAASGKVNGTYGYRAHGCNVTGCSPWSNIGTVAVLYPPSTPTLSVPASNSTGAYSVSWASVSTTTTYILQEQINGGAWSTVQSSSATSWSPTGKTNNTYGYQVQACNASGCSAWSPVSAVVVLLPPGNAPSLSTPANNATGAYAVSWTSVATATNYNLQEQTNGGAWSTVQSNGGTAWSAAGKSNGTYTYRAQACNGGGCGPWSATGSTIVLLPPGSPPSVSSPSNNSSGSYTVSWSTIPSATSYTLQEQLNGGSWTSVQSTGATSWGATGKANGTYGYQVQSCNAGGCSAWSSVSTTTVLHPPASAPSLTVPGSSTTGSYTVSWAGVATATSYTLQEQVNGGGGDDGTGERCHQLGRQWPWQRDLRLSGAGLQRQRL